MRWEQVKNNAWFDSQRLIAGENGNNLDYLPKKNKPKNMLIIFFDNTSVCRRIPNNLNTS